MDYRPTTKYPREDQTASARLVSDANKFVALNKASEILDEGEWDTHNYETPIGKTMQKYYGDKAEEGNLNVTDIVEGITYQDRRHSRDSRRISSSMRKKIDRLAYQTANPYSKLNEPNTGLTDNDLYAIEEFSKYNPELYLDYVQQRNEAWQGFFDYASKNPDALSQDPIMLQYKDEDNFDNLDLFNEYENLMKEKAVNKRANDEASNYILKESIIRDNLGSKLEQKLFTLGVMKDNMAHKISDGLNQLSLLVDDEEEMV